MKRSVYFEYYNNIQEVDVFPYSGHAITKYYSRYDIYFEKCECWLLICPKTEELKMCLYIRVKLNCINNNQFRDH